MWARLRASKINKDGNELQDACRSLNVNEEYCHALRTKSYVEFFSKAQLLANEPSSPSWCHNKISEILLEPRQETITAILESPLFPKKSDLKALILDYFDISAEASNICSHLLKSISQIQSNYALIQRALDKMDNPSSSPKQYYGFITSELRSFIILKNPFSNLDKQDFKIIHDKYSSVLQLLKSKRKKVARRIKLINCFNKASGICVTAACGLVAIAAMVIAAHTLTAILMGPALLSLPLKPLKRKLLHLRLLRSGFLRKIRDQLDLAAKGTYILNRDFDTMSRLVARVYDEIEHNKEMIKLCLDRMEDRFSLQVLKELKKSDVGFRKQVEELEEHVCLCLVTINRARALVIKEITTSYVEDLVP